MKKDDLVMLLLFIIEAIVLILLAVSTPRYSKYDVNKDRSVDIKDLVELQKYLVEEK